MPFEQLRSKTGCLKCKARRKKCDEKRPRCTPCSRWNFVCLWPSISSQARDVEAEKSEERTSVIAMRSRAGKAAQDHKGDGNGPVNLGMPELSVSQYGSSWDSEERLAFDFFQSQTSNQLSGVFRIDREMDIWSRMLLQGAHQSPEIKHAVCALGALHQNLWGKPKNDRGQTYLLAMRQYNKAIQSTIRSAGHPNTSVDAVLVMCILLAILERMLGDMDVAMSHVRAGIKLLTDDLVRSADSDKDSPSSSEATCLSRATIITLLRRLERQMYELGHTRTEFDYIHTSVFKVEIPAAFISLEDASATFELYFNYAFDLMHTVEWREEKQHRAQKPVEAELVSLLRRILSRWTKAFLSFLHIAKLNDARTSGPERLMVHTLQLHRLVLSASLAHYQTGDEMICDKFIPEFAEAVVHAAAVVRTQRLISELGRSYGDVIEEIPLVWGSDASINLDWFPSCSSEPFGHPSPGTVQEIHINPPGKPILTFTPFSPIPALYTISFRCRDPTVRRLAVRLLQDIDWYDGFWDSKMCSRLAERIMQIEENRYLLGPHNSRHNQRVEKAEQILPTARCRQIRGSINQPNVVLVEFSNINVNEWVPEADYLEKSGPSTFWDVGRIREKWIINN